MPYQVNVFQNWVSFNSWADLKNWLVSEAGGKLRVIEPRDSPFALVRYTKGQSDFSMAHVRWCRSVVVNKELRVPVSVAPPKASELKDDSLDAVTVAEEFVDGTMVNVFSSTGDSGALLATRSRLNASGSFYEGGPSFASMLKDALTLKGIDGFENVLPTHGVKDAVGRFTSTVVQHPANRIVRKVDAANLVIVHQGWVLADGTVFVDEDAGSFTYTSSDADADMEIQPYNLEAVRAAKSVNDWVSSQAQERGVGWQGVVLKDGNGQRWRVRSQVYETVRRLRGNESAANERYARLRKTRSVDQYLSFYPEDRDTFFELEGLLRKNTRQLSRFYVETFRARKVAFHTLPWPYKHHVSVLHNMYKDTLRSAKQKVDLDVVIRYVNGLNYDDTVNMLKQHKLDLKVDTAAPVTAAAADPATEDVAA